MKKSIAIIGGGPAALLLAAFLDTDQFAVSIYEKNKAVGRKFLVAGKGGFNLTHAEPIQDFTKRYTPDYFLEKALLDFDNAALRQWLEKIGIPTFVGSSKRVFPVKGIKPIAVLNAILAVLKQKNIGIQYGQKWTGWDEDNALLFDSGLVVKADYVVFALGGGSWKVTGSDGSWLDTFAAKGISTRPFVASNCAYGISWPEGFRIKNEGLPLKNIALTCGEKTQKGELVITKFGLEGNAIYALSPQIQAGLQTTGAATVFIDLKPSLTTEVVLKKIRASKEKNTTLILRKVLKLSPPQINLLKTQLAKAVFLDSELLGQHIKKLPLKVSAAAPLDEAISTTGGIALSAVHPHFELKQLKHQFCVGEMLDWNAPTGGYLLQACFSMGVFVARYLAKLL